MNEKRVRFRLHRFSGAPTFFRNFLFPRGLIFGYDILAIPVSWFISVWMRYNLSGIPEEFLYISLRILPFIVVIQAASFWFFGLYRGIWRFASISDVLRILKAVFVGGCTSILVLYFFRQLNSIPRSIWPGYILCLITLLGSPRFLYRWVKDYNSFLQKGQRVLVVGAGQAGEQLVRDLLRDIRHLYTPVGFVDDKSNHIGLDIHGVQVIGRCRDIPLIVQKHHITLIFIAVPSANSACMRRIVGFCEKAKVPFRTLPDLNDLAEGRVNTMALRDVSIEDLLGRDQVTLDWTRIRDSIENKQVLVSGGGGSIGSELCRQIAKLNPTSLIILEHSEFNLYQIESELQKLFPKLALRCFLCDVTDEMHVQEIMDMYHPHIVFHAAAYKHVPMLQTQIRSAVFNNMIGTYVMAKSAVAARVHTFVLISTDKAVKPTNVMGASKRGAEIICQNFQAASDTSFITVRFGNVLNSAGSVIPLFRKQIAAGGPVTVTHPDVTRFFMTIPEASQLILQASVLGKGGEIFVLDMGKPISIRYLAKQMIQLSKNNVKEQSIEITYTGLRPGEKLHEELFHDSETRIATNHEKILQAISRKRDWNQIQKILQNMICVCQEKQSEIKLQLLLQELVLDYAPEVETISSENKISVESSRSISDVAG